MQSQNINAVCGCNTVQSAKMVVETISAKDWEQKITNSEMPTVVNFSAVRCGFCKMLEPLYVRISDQYKGKLQFFRLMVDDEPSNHEAMHHVAIQGTPTLKFYCKGREVGEHVGYAIEPTLKKKIDSFLQEMESCLANSTSLLNKEEK